MKASMYLCQEITLHAEYILCEWARNKNKMKENTFTCLPKIDVLFVRKFTQPQGAGCNKRFYDYGCAVERFKNTNKTSIISQIFTNNCLCKKKALKSEEELHKHLSNPLFPIKNFKHAYTVRIV